MRVVRHSGSAVASSALAVPAVVEGIPAAEDARAGGAEGRGHGVTDVVVARGGQGEQGEQEEKVVKSHDHFQEWFVDTEFFIGCFGFEWLAGTDVETENRFEIRRVRFVHIWVGPSTVLWKIRSRNSIPVSTLLHCCLLLLPFSLLPLRWPKKDHAKIRLL